MSYPLYSLVSSIAPADWAERERERERESERESERDRDPYHLSIIFFSQWQKWYFQSLKIQELNYTKLSLKSHKILSIYKKVITQFFDFVKEFSKIQIKSCKY